MELSQNIYYKQVDTLSLFLSIYIYIYIRLPINPSTQAELESFCEDLQKKILNFIEGNDEVFKANYVASYGNLVDSVNTTDWIQIKSNYVKTDACLNFSLAKMH